MISLRSCKFCCTKLCWESSAAWWWPVLDVIWKQARSLTGEEDTFLSRKIILANVINLVTLKTGNDRIFNLFELHCRILMKSGSSVMALTVGYVYLFNVVFCLCQFALYLSRPRKQKDPKSSTSLFRSTEIQTSGSRTLNQWATSQASSVSPETLVSSHNLPPTPTPRFFCMEDTARWEQLHRLWVLQLSSLNTLHFVQSQENTALQTGEFIPSGCGGRQVGQEPVPPLKRIRPGNTFTLMRSGTGGEQHSGTKGPGTSVLTFSLGSVCLVFFCHIGTHSVNYFPTHSHAYLMKPPVSVDRRRRHLTN